MTWGWWWEIHTGVTFLILMSLETKTTTIKHKKKGRQATLVVREKLL